MLSYFLHLGLFSLAHMFTSSPQISASYFTSFYPGLVYFIHLFTTSPTGSASKFTSLHGNLTFLRFPSKLEGTLKRVDSLHSKVYIFCL